MSTVFSIRTGVQGDANRLSALATQVWLHTYATDGISEPLAGYVLSELTPAKFLQSLAVPATTFLVAERNQGLIGFAAIKFGVDCPATVGSATKLATLYVQEHFTGQGVGKALLQAAEALARAQAKTALWLTVNVNKVWANAFYARHGYTKVGTAYFQLGQGRHENHLLTGQAG